MADGTDVWPSPYEIGVPVAGDDVGFANFANGPAFSHDGAFIYLAAGGSDYVYALRTRAKAERLY